ncbi:MAG: AAA family ATPase [Eubacterium sp.]|nr:AAA family ATPase [Eubacterium sp.]
MSNVFSFKRKLYYDTLNAVDQTSAVFLLGPRKCGKTVCLQQINDTHANSEYYNIKNISLDDANALYNRIIKDINNSIDRLYLIDEVTYFDLPEKVIANIAFALGGNNENKTKVVFAGSQSIALEAWANRAFAGNAKLIYGEFLSYSEWLKYKNIEEVSAKTYNDFLYETKSFNTGFVTLDDYLKGCLEETVQSNLKTSNVILHNECNKLDENILKNVLYAALIAQEDRPTINNFFDRNKLLREIRSFMNEAYQSIGSEQVQQRIDRIFADRLSSYSTKDIDTLRQALVFLYRCDLITLSYVSPENSKFENIIDVYKDLCDYYDPKINNKEKLFRDVNISIKYPMFYVEILKEVLQEYMPKELNGTMLGGIVECHARGLLPQKDQYEYHNNGREIDYVNYSKAIAVEFTIRNKSNKETAFNDLPYDFTNILLTKDIDLQIADNNNIIRIPYYKFIYELSNDPDYLNKIPLPNCGLNNTKNYN